MLSPKPTTHREGHRNRRGQRTFTCDEATPECTPCKKRRIPCAGYGSNLAWVTDQNTYVSHNRRVLRCDLTWVRAPILSPSQQDYYISLCDTADLISGLSIEWSEESKIPFGVFPTFQNVANGCSSVPRSLGTDLPLKDKEAFLFRHYVSHVASMMMPYEDDRNPWYLHYPKAALQESAQQHKALYKAMLAQAAVNLAHLGSSRENNLLIATSYYVSAIQDLRSCINDQQQDYGTFLAAILTLMFVEVGPPWHYFGALREILTLFQVYNGHSGTWRAHLDGAWSFLEGQQDFQSYFASEFSWASTQSFCLIKIVSETTRLRTLHTTMADTPSIQCETNNLLQLVSSRDSFGYTIGATRLLLTCIADIQSLAHQIDIGTEPDLVDHAVKEIMGKLSECRGFSSHSRDSPSQTKYERKLRYQLNAFVAATHIYLCRIIFDLPPSEVRPYVQETFANIQEFYALGGGNFSLWPAFVAAAEAYDEDLDTARKWLDSAMRVGMGNRLEVKRILECIWQKRQRLALEQSQDLGSVVIDWRHVMLELDIDILLV
ncbi:hypothetical protein BP6252_13336 [Coleophoma cylindrospora]|uniref:Zn(2)-C6 fungal-type domain-containing protein n=1 Tax=Coleophoma cylindrospora TaxID=1849047 RepID=A0A3D8QB34_9HELO|nr:hypothetical protein BP6252_13336 [Coleophoma cylindrospora]